MPTPRPRPLTVLAAALISLATAPAARAADAAALIASVEALESFVAEERALAAEQITAHTKTITDNAEALAGSEEAVKACIAFLAAYDDRAGPLFVNSPAMSNKAPKPENTIHWAAFWVMQHLLDQAYHSEGLERFGELIGKVKFGTADYFPGKVGQPITDGPYTVRIDGSYPQTWGAPMFQAERPARKPTGAYLVPGTVATVTVPDALVGKGGASSRAPTATRPSGTTRPTGRPTTGRRPGRSATGCRRSSTGTSPTAARANRRAGSLGDDGQADRCIRTGRGRVGERVGRGRQPAVVDHHVAEHSLAAGRAARPTR